METRDFEYKPNLKKLKIKTLFGMKSFDGIRKILKKGLIEIQTHHFNLKCSLTHKVLTERNWISADELQVGEKIETINGEEEIISISIDHEKEETFYDLVNVEGGNTYLTNGIVSHNCEFLSSDALLINTLRLIELKASLPISEELGFKYWKPIGGRGKVYLMSVDIATGNGNDFSVIDVFEFPSLEQVVQWRSNVMNIPMLYQAIKYMLSMLTRQDSHGFRPDVFWTFERNGVGEAIKALLFNDEKPNEFAELVSDKPDEMGMNTSGKTKILACLHVKQLVEKQKDGLKLNSDKTIFELQNFVASGGSYAAKKGATDDTVSSLLLISRLLKQICMYDDRAIDILYDYSNQFDDTQTEAPMPILIV